MSSWVSGCCSAPFWEESDICGQCKEHAGEMCEVCSEDRDDCECVECDSCGENYEYTYNNLESINCTETTCMSCMKNGYEKHCDDMVTRKKEEGF